MYFLGHSLGGAIANLAAFDYPLVSKYKGVLKPHLVTFGSPPVGNMEFVKQYNKQLIPSTLVTSGFNLVPNVHLLGTYLHAKIEIYILPGGKHTIQCLYNDEAFANDPACSPDLSLMNCSIADHILSDNEGASDDEYYDALDYSDLPESGFSDIGIPSMTYPDPNGRSDRPLLV
ncbi:Alpha/Beta hydrolase protein [Dimargaris cristalligena]|uniref:Alpha/Beta hydrolase protein n=1 Tax=Dimargaris cristalligena TaxID=215637 RepID=A0A4P9ZL64_9FUNG|nr:Alpha/Beta hydrolase protein [Dimargaris cristalligena]|eukprot:RKP33221.1 Alpha/Beta hydrolase protein [Dimargaris cristalligena]